MYWGLLVQGEDVALDRVVVVELYDQVHQVHQGEEDSITNQVRMEVELDELECEADVEGEVPCLFAPLVRVVEIEPEDDLLD